MINLCVPVLKRYDLLREMVQSAVVNTMPPDVYYVIDNGRDEDQLTAALDDLPILAYVHVPREGPMGVAEAWNWFIQRTTEERFIVNDDILFAPESIAKMVEAKAAFVSCSFGFSCFLLRDACVRKVGLFDETISPGYAYFEDMDYLRRMRLEDVADDVVLCDVVHRQSSTPQKFTPREWDEHYRKFNLAQMNYMRKWANNPNWEQLKAIGGNGAHQ